MFNAFGNIKTFNDDIFELKLPYTPYSLAFHGQLKEILLL